MWLFVTLRLRSTQRHAGSSSAAYLISYLQNGNSTAAYLLEYISQSLKCTWQREKAKSGILGYLQPRYSNSSKDTYIDQVFSPVKQKWCLFNVIVRIQWEINNHRTGSKKGSLYFLLSLAFPLYHQLRPIQLMNNYWEHSACAVKCWLWGSCQLNETWSLPSMDGVGGRRNPVPWSFFLDG